jgi:tetratricopeptide (TPR) repeat protein
MLRPIALFLVCTSTLAIQAQQGPQPQPDSKVNIPKKNSGPPRSAEQKPAEASDAKEEYSSSREAIIDLSPPIGDKQMHPDSEEGDVQELKPWNPHRAMKNVEVGDFYFKRKNYVAAESRYREALKYKPNDAVATFRLAQVLDRTRRSDEALAYYQAYLKILPHGEFSEECQKAIARLSNTAKKQ